MTIIVKNKESLVIDDFRFRCCVGKRGVSKLKREGDKKTPKGLFKIGNLFYRKDKNKKPLTKLKCIPINKKMGWCNDTKNKNKYNKLIYINKSIKHEKLFRADTKYDFLIPITYNTKKRILKKGSAIFIHITKNYKGTDGCIALIKKDFLIFLKLVKPKMKIKIV